MPLDIPSGSTVFIDSTILHYAFVSFESATPQCVELLNRIATQDLRGCLSLPVLNDAVHKVMCSESAARFSQPRTGLVRWMKSNPDRVRELTHAGDVLRLANTLPIQLLPADLISLCNAQDVVRQYGMLANDALVLALMLHHGINHIATNDNDFDHVPGITVWKPV